MQYGVQLVALKVLPELPLLMLLLAHLTQSCRVLGTPPSVYILLTLPACICCEGNLWDVGDVGEGGVCQGPS